MYLACSENAYVNYLRREKLNGGIFYVVFLMIFNMDVFPRNKHNLLEW